MKHVQSKLTETWSVTISLVGSTSNWRKGAKFKIHTQGFVPHSARNSSSRDNPVLPLKLKGRNKSQTHTLALVHHHVLRGGGSGGKFKITRNRNSFNWIIFLKNCKWHNSSMEAAKIENWNVTFDRVSFTCGSRSGNVVMFKPLGRKRSTRYG